MAHPHRAARSPRGARGAVPVLAAALLLAAAAPPAAAETAPKITHRELFSKSLEVARRAMEQYGGAEDPAEARRVADVGYRVARESRFAGYPLTFHLIDMPEPNAFALPGGHLFVTRGMLDLGLDDDMLAALLGHEIAHVALDHHSKVQRKATLMSVLSQALLVGVIIAAEGSEPVDPMDRRDPRYRDDRGELIQGTAATSLIVSELLLRSFSREHEDQADEEGQRWAAAAGFDPEGANRLFALMQARIPQSRQYGYWRTHPFFDERVRAGAGRAKLLKRLEAKPADDFRVRTQAALLAWLDGQQVEPGDEFRDTPDRVSEATARFVEEEALTAWPKGTAAERIRLEKLHRTERAMLERPALERDYGEVVRAYATQIAEVRELTPESGFLARLERERAALEAQADDLYPKAAKTLAEGVVETPFLERFLSNWPDAPEAPKAALLLGDAKARLGDASEAVRRYLRALETSPGSPEAERAARGLAVLAPRLDDLAALQQLARQDLAPEVARLAAARLGERAASFSDVDNGAAYLSRFPEGDHVTAVAERMNVLADKLYAEVLVYQAIGDHVKAVERINKILTFAPLSPAADLLRERAVVDASA